MNCFFCNICFSRRHNSLYCPERKTIPTTKLFLPNKIDKDLIKRYMECLNYEEQYSLAFTLPKAFNSIKLKKLVICDTYNNYFNNNGDFTDSVLFIKKEVQLKNVLSDSSFCSIISKAVKVSITSSMISSEKFLQFLSPHTEEIYCSDVKFASKLVFREVVKRVPNIKKIDFLKTDVELEYSWPDDLMKWKSGDDFESLTISINDFDFDVEALKKLVKTRSTKSSRFHLFIEVPDVKYYEGKSYQFFRKLDKYFYETHPNVKNMPILTIQTGEKVEIYTCVQKLFD